MAGSATELFGSMGRTKDRVSPLTQGSSSNALLEVIAQLRQQNQVLLFRPYVHDCVEIDEPVWNNLIVSIHEGSIIEVI